MPPMNAENETISCRPRKYQGAFAGFSGTSGFANSFNGASEMNASADADQSRQHKHAKLGVEQMRHRRNRVLGARADSGRLSFHNRSELICLCGLVCKDRIEFLRLVGDTLVRVRRSRQAAVLANSPEMYRHQARQDERQYHHVKQIKADQRLFTDDLGAEQDLTLQAARYRNTA